MANKLHARGICLVGSILLSAAVTWGQVSSLDENAYEIGNEECSGLLTDGCTGVEHWHLLGDLFKPSDHCFDDFISPMSNFVFFEDPRTLTEARPIFVYHELPNSIGTLGLPGGDVQLYALQLRLALSERLSIIAVKDGYIVADIDGGPLDTLLNDGWAAVTAGLKYNLYRDPEFGTLLSTGLTYEMPVGSSRSLQAIGDGEFHAFVTGGQRLYGDRAHYLGAFGFRVPVDGGVQTTSFHLSNHLDFRLFDRFYLVGENIWWHWTDSANNGLPLGVAGQDLFNLYSTNVAGNDLITQSIGFKYKSSGHSELGISFEFPLTNFKDIIDNRLQIEWIWRY